MASASCALRSVLLLSLLGSGCVSESFKKSAALAEPVGTTKESGDAESTGPPTRLAAKDKMKDKVQLKDDDEWNDVGRHARSDQLVEKENDPLRKWLVSPKAQDIERSLGVD